MSNNGQVRTKGNFSNNNRDTFDPANHFIGVRLQQGVPMLDRDWNELEDTRRHFEWTLRKFFIGNGSPANDDGFKIQATNPVSNDFIITHGRCMVEGFDVPNDMDTRYTQQGLQPLPVPNAPTKYVVFLEVWTEPVTSQEDPSLRNAQDINLETCVRDQLRWAVKAATWPLTPGSRATYILAAIDRPANKNVIEANMITDLRRLNLTLADVVDIAADLKPRVRTLEDLVNALDVSMQDVKQELGRLFWDVEMNASTGSADFGQTVPVTVTVRNAKGPVVGVRVEFSTDYGNVSPSSATTNLQGQATTKLLGVEASRPPDDNELPILENVAKKVVNAKTPNAVAYSMIKFEPQEMSVISKYSHPSTFVDIERNLADIRIVPPSKTATVTCYAKQGPTIVRGIGTAQITFSQWVRDWVKTKVSDTIREVDVSSRVGAKFGAAWKAEEKDLEVKTINEGIFDVYSDVAFEAHNKLVKNAFTDIVPDDALGKAGVVAQTIAQAVTNQVGQKTNTAVKNEITNFQKQGLGENKAVSYQKTILQNSNQANAGVAQGFKMTFGSGG